MELPGNALSEDVQINNTMIKDRPAAFLSDAAECCCCC